VAEQFQQVTGNGIQPDDPRYDDPENPENREFSTFETTYDGAYDSEGNPDPENRDDQDFSWESETESSTSIVKKLGANQDVIDGLSHVTFVTGCEMSDAIAYIRYWSRSGVTPKTTVTLEQAFTLPSDALKKLDDELGDMYRLPGDFNTSYSLPEDYNPSDYFNLSEKSNKTTLTVPENTAYQSRPRQPVPTRQPSLPRLDFKAGNVFSANPSGIVQGSTSAAPSDAVWHFLFNPEELQLSSGPEYNKAETWGVSDPTNSGQPLSWRNNRNRKLTFNKVLLHGYSFGKRVDSLEKGLQDLFMAREGEGSDGPPVLEFVWGKRHFGPCVIQNIQVREKAWDKGLLVNAEVSFDLEQVPEWTINDGFVDVLRPGRQPLINDPVLPPSTQAAGASPEDEESKKNDDKKTPDGGKPPVTGDPVFCNEVLKYKLLIQKEFDSTGVILRRAALFDPGLNMETTEKSISDKYYDKFSQLGANPNISNPSAKSYNNFNFNYINTRAPGCTREEYLSTRKNILGSNPGRGERIRSVQFINGCLKLISESRNEWIKKESKGGGFCAPLVSSRQAAEKTSQENKKCEKYKAAVSSSSGQPQVAKCSRGEAGTRATCGNVSYHCERSSAKSNDWIWIARN